MDTYVRIQKTHRIRGSRKVYRLEGYTWEAEPCVYCGEPSSTVDHFTPTSYVEDMADIEVTFKIIRLYAACAECNSIKTDMIFDTMKEARQYVQAHLLVKYKRYLQIPPWSEQELEQVDYVLRTYVEYGIRARDRIRRRLQWRA